MGGGEGGRTGSGGEIAMLMKEMGGGPTGIRGMGQMGLLGGGGESGRTRSGGEG